MNVMLLGKSLIDTTNINLVDRVEDSDYVVISNSLRAYYLGSSLGELLNKAYQHEFEFGRPQVIKEDEFNIILNKVRNENSNELY